MDEGRDWPGWVLSGGAGTALWLAIAAMGGGREPWDTGAYWTAGYPLSLLLAAVCGWLFPSRSWRWAVALTFTQLPVMVAGGSGLGLLPLGAVLLAILSLPLVAVARLSGWLRAWAVA